MPILTHRVPRLFLAGPEVLPREIVSRALRSIFYGRGGVCRARQVQSRSPEAERASIVIFLSSPSDLHAGLHSTSPLSCRTACSRIARRCSNSSFMVTHARVGTSFYLDWGRHHASSSASTASSYSCSPGGSSSGFSRMRAIIIRRDSRFRMGEHSSRAYCRASVCSFAELRAETCRPGEARRVGERPRQRAEPPGSGIGSASSCSPSSSPQPPIGPTPYDVGLRVDELGGLV